MTDQHRISDETQPHAMGATDAPASPPEATDPDVRAGVGRAIDATGTDATPADPTPADPTPADAAAPVAGSGLRADPSRPSDTTWREPAWFPPKERAREPRSNPVAIVVGLIMIGVGLYFFVDRTLGVALPRIAWGAIWPIILIVIGGVVLLRSVNRRT